MIPTVCSLLTNLDVLPGHVTQSKAAESSMDVSMLPVHDRDPLERMALTVTHGSCRISFNIDSRLSLSELRRKLVRNFDLMAIVESDRLTPDFVIELDADKMGRFLSSELRWRDVIAQAASSKRLELRIPVRCHGN